MGNPHPTLHCKKLKDIDPKLAERILQRHPLSFLGGCVFGERGVGKSMYCYKIMAKVYYDYNGFYKTDDEASAYDEALKHMVFEVKDFIKLINYNIKHDYVTPVLTLDDATVHFCSYKFFTDLKEVVYLHGLFDLIRSSCTGLLMTTPNRKLLLSFLRQYDDYRIKIYMRDHRWQRYARCYRWNYLPDEKKYHIYIPFQDNFSCYVQEEYFKKYMAKRKKAFMKINNEMMKMMKKDKEGI